MTKEKVIHKKKDGPRELVVTKEVHEDGIIIDADDIKVKPPTPIPEEEKKKEVPKSKKKKKPVLTVSDVELKELETIEMWTCPLCSFGSTKFDDLNYHIISIHEVDPSVILISKVTTTFYRTVKK